MNHEAQAVQGVFLMLMFLNHSFQAPRSSREDLQVQQVCAFCNEARKVPAIVEAIGALDTERVDQPLRFSSTPFASTFEFTLVATLLIISWNAHRCIWMIRISLRHRRADCT